MGKVDTVSTLPNRCSFCQMVYKYMRKTDQAKWSENSMMLAIADCNAGIPIKTTAKKYGLPYSTLYRHWKKGNSTAQLGRFRKVFNDQQEGDLQTYLQEMDDVFYGLTPEDFKALAYIYAKRNDLIYPQSWDKNGKAGDDWLAAFRRRNPQITLRVPEATSVARVKGFNRPQVERFYELLNLLIQKYGIDGTRIYNVDETGIQTSTKRPPKVLSIKGKKQVGVISSTERGQTTTIVCCCNAAGSFTPPFMIFARKRMQDRLLDGSPPETQGTCSPSGWITREIFLEWLKFFVSHVRPTAEKKVLLLLDNHESHKHFPVLEYASQNNVVILSLPPHTSNKLQPLDVAVYGALKIYFEQEVNRFQKSHPGRIINQYDVARLFAPAYLKCATPSNAIKGFQSPGIWPINMDVWEEKDFAPSSTVLTASNTANQEAVLPKTTNQDVVAATKNQETTLQNTSNQDVVTTTPIIPPDTSSDNDVEPFEPMIVTVQGDTEIPEKSDIPTAEVIYPRTTDSGGVSPSIISELHEKNQLINNITDPRVFTPTIQELSLQKENTSNEYVNSAIEIEEIKEISTGHMNRDVQNADIEENSVFSTEIIALLNSTLPTNIPKPIEEDSLKYNASQKSSTSTATPISYLSPKEIRPLPTPHVPMGNRKRKFQKSEVLTSTPVKEQQKAKFVKTRPKLLRNIDKDLDTKTKTTLKKNTDTTKITKMTKRTKTTKIVKTIKNVKTKKSKDKENDEKYTCYFCGEDYTEINEQPLDDWIQCNSCKQWSHEKCTAYEGNGIFLCDNCTDD